MQGGNGFIYNGTGSGLSEWDGERWAIYPTPNKTLIRSLTKWKDGLIYAGTTNDIGYYDINKKGRLAYNSLVTDWSTEQRQFGQVWSTASNQYGVIFVTRKMVLFWNGKKVQIIKNAAPGMHRVFALKDRFVYKVKDDPFIYQISASLEVSKTKLQLPKEAVARLITNNRKNRLVAFTSRDGIFAQGNENMELRVESQALGKNVRVYHGLQARDGYYYIATLHHGLFILNESFTLLRQYTEKHNIGGDKIYSIMEDIQGNIWLSGAPNIIKLIPPHKYSRYQTSGKIPLANQIGLFQNRVMVAAHGFYQMQLPTEFLEPAYFDKIPFISGAKWDFLEYQNHFVYAGEGGVFAQEIIAGKMSEKRIKLGSSTIGKALFIDPVSNSLFAATADGIIINQLKDGKWFSQPVNGLTDELRILSIDNNGIVWAGTETQELYRVENAQFPEKETKIQKFTGVDGLGANDVLPYKLSTGIVVGTNDGLMDYKPDRQPPLKFVSGYPAIFTSQGQDINRLYEDINQRIWYRIGDHTGYIEKNLKGIWQTNEKIFKTFPKNGSKGFLATKPNIMWFVSSIGDIYRVNIELTNQLPSKGILNIRQIINIDNNEDNNTEYNKLNLPQFTQETNSIRIHYALAENANANPTLYRHKLIGSQNERWSKWLSETHKDYTGLAGSSYRFMLEAKDGWGRVSSTDLNFLVLPPWYLSGLAWSIYSITFLILLALSGWITQRWRTAKLQRRNEELEQKITLRIREVKDKSEQLQQQQILKDRFFSNVSHEFRTPLTLVMMPLQDLLRSHPNLGRDVSFPVEAALRNSQKLMELVGQVLDINRLESGQFPLNVAEYDIADLVNRIVSRLEPWAEQHQQTLWSDNINDPTMIFCDQDQLEKCISNLISNAIKYSGDGSLISVSLTKDELNDNLGIKVSDNGQGISQHAETKVFERFYQDKQSEQITDPGTGIGLSLVKELMALHHGHVELINQPGKGCVFILWLKRGDAHFKLVNQFDNIEKVSSDENINKLTHAPIVLPPQLVINTSSFDETPDHQKNDITTLLVVDDNSELRHFIALRLSSYYRIIQASNGQEGLARAKQDLPDLIISDVMMPIKNGMEMTRELKLNPETSSIPIILLTAKSSKRETVEGLQTGADDYLTKPFDTSELIVRVAGLINNRKKLRRKIEAEFSNAKIAERKSQTFSEKLQVEVLSQINQPDFSINNIASALALSRRSLDRKCQQELNQSVGNFITEVRMQSAFSLLSDDSHSISEVAYAMGYESLAYFSRSFKKFYGKPPSSVERKTL